MVIFAHARNGEHDDFNANSYRHALNSIACHILVCRADTPLVCPRECNLIPTSRTTPSVPTSSFEAVMVCMFSNDQLYSIR